MPAPDVLVVGAGVVGAACAEAAAAAGLSVTVLESRSAGGGATAAAMGHIVVMDDSEAQFALTELSRRLWTELAPSMPASCEDEPTGTLWVAADEEELALVGRKAAFYRQRGVAVEELDGRGLAAAEPNLRPGLAGALRVPGDRVVYPVNAARWLLERAVARGAVRRERVEALAIEGGRVRTRDGVLDAGAVVNAAGAAAPRLTSGLPIRPRKGHLVITDRYPGYCRHQLVELGYLKSAHAPSPESVAFNLQPRATGQMLLGSSREFVGFDDSINRSLRGRMIRRALEFMPSIAGLSAIRTWVGFRPATPDNLPLLGRHDSEARLYVAAGHEGLGITTALASGRLVVDAILGRASPIDRAPYSPMRAFPAGAHA
jgi:glycine/D-amino acid oxidase-like deaminating enzyme